MRTFLFVLPIEQITVGAVYSSLPLHCTLISWFNADVTPEVLLDNTSPVFKQRGHIELVSDTPALFGKNNDIPVRRLALSPSLKDLHDDLLNILTDMGVNYVDSSYVGDGYHPHVTTKNGRSFLPCSHQTIDSVYLVELLKADKPAGKKVLAKISLL